MERTHLNGWLLASARSEPTCGKSAQEEHEQERMDDGSDAEQADSEHAVA